MTLEQDRADRTCPRSGSIDLEAARIAESMQSSGARPRGWPARRVAVIVVTHNSSEMIGGWIDALDRTGRRSQMELCVVDSGSTPEERRFLSERIRPRVDMLCERPNLGYGRSCNVGAEHTVAPVLLFTNPDTRLLSLPGEMAALLLASAVAGSFAGARSLDERMTATSFAAAPASPEHTSGGAEPIRLLVVTNMYPAEDHPAYGTFVAEQVEALRSHPSIELVDVLFVNGRKSSFEYFRAIPDLRQRVRTGRYDLIHAHYGLSGAVAVSQSRVPVIVTYHSGDIDYVRWQRWVSRAVARRSARNICVARRDIDTLGQPAIHIPCGLDIERFAPRDRRAARLAFGVPDGYLAVLFPSGRDHPKKMYPRFAEVRMELETRGHRVHELRLENVPRERVPDLLAATDVMVMTSVSEGAPVVVIEALAAGVPVVATPVGEVEFMLGGVENCVVDQFDARRFASAVESVAQDHPRAPGPRSEDYSQPRIVSALINVYRSCLRRGAFEHSGRGRITSPQPS